MRYGHLIAMGKVLGYPITDAGLCQGYNAMWIQAVCAEDLGTFESRMRLLAKYENNPKFLLRDINVAREMQKTAGVILTPEQQALLEVPAFFEGIAAYLSPEILFEATESGMNQTHILEISKYVASVRQEEKGLVKPFTMAGQYTPESLAVFLEKLHNCLDNHPGTAVLLGNPTHSAGIRCMGNNSFELVDSNRLELEGQTFSAEKLSLELYKSFYSDPASDEPILVFEVFGNAQSGISADTFRELQNTPLPARLTHYRHITLLHLAAYYNDVDTLEKICQGGNDINVFTEETQETPLYYASLACTSAAFDFLLSSGKMSTKTLASTLGSAAANHLQDYYIKAILAYTEQKGIRLADLVKSDEIPVSPLKLACKTKNVRIIELFFNQNEPIPLTMDEVKPGGSLMKILPSCNTDAQKKILISALKAYLETRSEETEQTGSYGSFFSAPKTDRLKAAQTLLDNLERNEDKPLGRHEGHLGRRLGEFLKIYLNLDRSDLQASSVQEQVHKVSSIS